MPKGHDMLDDAILLYCHHHNHDVAAACNIPVPSRPLW